MITLSGLKYIGNFIIFGNNKLIVAINKQLIGAISCNWSAIVLIKIGNWEIIAILIGKKILIAINITDFFSVASKMQ